ncbi:unnamed protein product [Pylaiella littoralis]
MELLSQLRGYNPTDEKIRARHRLKGMLSYQELWSKSDKQTLGAKAKTLYISVEKSRTAGDLVLPPLVSTAAPSSATSTPLADGLGRIGSGSAIDIAMTAAGVSGVGIGAAGAAGVDGAGRSLPGAQTARTPARDIFVRPGQPRKAQRSGNDFRAKKTRAEVPPESDQLATAPDPSALSSVAAATKPPQGLGFRGLVGARIPTVAGKAGGAPPAPAQAPLVGITAGGLATPTNSTMDLAFLADAAAAATSPTDRALGALDIHAAGRHYNQSLAATAVASLRDSEAALASIAAAATEIDNGAPIPPPLSSQEFISTSVPSRSIATASTPAAAEASSDGGASGDWSSSMPAYSASRATAAGTAPVSLDIDLAAQIGVGNADDTEENISLACLVNSIDPSDSKTLRVRGAMMSRLKSVRRTTVAG